MIFERKFKGKKFLYTKLQEKIDFFLKKKTAFPNLNLAKLYFYIILKIGRNHFIKRNRSIQEKFIFVFFIFKF